MLNAQSWRPNKCFSIILSTDYISRPEIDEVVPSQVLIYYIRIVNTVHYFLVQKDLVNGSEILTQIFDYPTDNQSIRLPDFLDQSLN